MAALGLVGVVAFTGSSCKKKDGSSAPEVQDPQFTSFTVTPSQVCLNVGVPIVRIAYEVDLGTWSNPSTLCVDLKANGEPVHVTVHHQCMDDGTSGEYTVNLMTYFGGTAPSTIEFTGELVPNVAGATKDTRSASVTTMPDCPPPGQLPG